MDSNPDQGNSPENPRNEGNFFLHTIFLFEGIDLLPK
jgi:hypothetical protein